MNTARIILDLLAASNDLYKAKDCSQSGGRKWTTLHAAVAFGDKNKVVNLLKEKQSLINKGNEDGWTPLHLAAALNVPDIVETLLSHDAQDDSNSEPAANAQNKAGSTPLHVAAAKARDPEIVRLLLEHRADPWLRNKKGQLPFDLAEKNKNLREIPVYWRLHQATYLPWRPP